ncbi:MAG: hypothetical protein KA974_06580 [Saprospiraceae bacterium]|nr:hypothetical protein [Saprospiraceae bacterium]MBP7679980.1 hypothetical protein [Saprospiraceae bacterium]
MTKRILYYLAIIVTGILGSCAAEKATSDDVLLATVYNQKLYLSELQKKGILNKDISAEDSAVVLNNYVERWVRDALIMQRAESNIPKDLNIDELVRDYRASLVRYNYQKVLIEQLTDKKITPEQLQTYYDQNKEQLRLQDAMVRAYYIKVPRSAPDTEQLKKWWSNRKDNMSKIAAYCNQYANKFMLVDTVWYQQQDIIGLFPKGALSAGNIADGREFTQKDDDFYYFLKCIEVIPNKDIPPLSAVQDKVEKLILHKRQSEIITQKTEELYELETKRNNVKIYTGLPAVPKKN